VFEVEQDIDINFFSTKKPTKDLNEKKDEDETNKEEDSFMTLRA